MAAVSGLAANYPGTACSGCRRLPLGYWTCRVTRDDMNYRPQLSSFRHQVKGSAIDLNTRHLWNRSAVVAPRTSNGDLSFGPDSSLDEPFWLALIRELVWSLKSLFSFLREQPSQLKYIEWPSFQSTLKTATLTLVLVALLIVALTSVDTVLS